MVSRGVTSALCVRPPVKTIPNPDDNETFYRICYNYKIITYLCFYVVMVLKYYAIGKKDLIK